MPKYHMHRKEREIVDTSKNKDLLIKGKFATIALCRGDEPYLVTLNYGFDDTAGCLYFHCAPKGLKLDFLLQNPNVCATVIEDLGYVDGQCDHRYRSVVIWGTMSIVKDPEEKRHGINVLLDHLEPHPEEIRKRSLSKEEAYQQVTILRLDIVQMSGKEHV